MKRKRRTAAQYVKLFEFHKGTCHICGHRIDGVREKYEWEHVIPWALTHDDSDENLRPAHKTCHEDKTKKDVADIAKAKRIEARHIGATVPKVKIASRPFIPRPKPDNKYDRMAAKQKEHDAVMDRKRGLA